jgi:hypothetical protein
MNSLGITFVDAVQLDTLEAFHDHLLEVASGIVAAGDECLPLIFVLTVGGKLAILPPLPSKDAAALYQQTVVQHPMVRACAIVFEAWMSHQTIEQRKANPDAMPVDDPKRSEAIVVSIMTAHRQAMTCSEIKRPSNKVERAPFEWIDETGGSFGGRFVR